MERSTANICAFGWKARDFALKGIDGKTYSLGDIRGPKGTLVVFICNHCPYVKSAIGRIVAETKALREIGVGMIAIMPNDTDAYPEDSFDNMKKFAALHDFSFPYVIDTTQEVARVYELSARPISLVSIRKTSCSIEVGLIPHARYRLLTLDVNCSKQ
jgi:peroxiredoxin